MTRPRVLVTGATGLIGRHVTAPLVALGYDVVALSRDGAAVPGAVPLAGDLLAGPKAIVAAAEADHLIHLAWADAPTDRWRTPANLDWLTASLDLLRHFSAAGGKRAVMVGSCAEYDWSAGRLSENTPLKPGTLYGAAKAATGMAALAAAPVLGVSLAWARPFFCYGPGEPEGRLFGDLIKGLAAGRKVACTDGLQRRDFLHTADIGRALACLLASPAEGAVNIGSGNAVAVRDLIQMLAAVMGRPDLIDLGARPRAADDPPLIEADVSRLKTLTGFSPQFDLESGVRDVLVAEGFAP